ncbi:MAG: GNAT family N-acetyltransferase [Bacteroidota bacterium]
MPRADIQLLRREEIDPQRWDAFIKASPQGSLYATHGYLSILREDWQAYIIEEKGAWGLVMPFVINQKWGYDFLPQLPLTQFGGPIYKDLSDMSERQQLSFLDRWLGLLADAWQAHHLIILNTSPAATYLLPFHWAGYELKKRYTFWWDIRPEEKVLMERLSRTLRRKVRKAEEANYTMCLEETPDALFALLKKNERAGHDVLAGNTLAWKCIQPLAHHLYTTGQGDLVIVKEGDQVLSAALFGKYQGQLLYLLGVYDPDYAKVGAMPWLIWKYVLQMKEKGFHTLDFEGSMIKGIAQFFRDFGVYPVAYTQLYRNQLPAIVSWIRELKT